MKLAMDIATENKRPSIRERWNPALSFLVTSCWCNNAALRPSLATIISSLSMLIKNASAEGMITSATIPEIKLEGGDPHFAPGALWRRVETRPEKIELGKVLGEGANATVYKGKFQGKAVAVKIFRNTSEESAFKEIEMTFSLRHPNVIGLYAWFEHRGALTQFGMVLELASSDLRSVYNKKNKDFSLGTGLKIVAGVAKGLAYMHSRPEAVVHRDVKVSTLGSSLLCLLDSPGNLLSRSTLW